MSVIGRPYRLQSFKKRHRLHQRDVNFLVKRGVIEIQQSGYVAHSQCHPKLVVVKDKERLGLLSGVRWDLNPRTTSKKVLNAHCRKNETGIYLKVPEDYITAYNIKPGQRVEMKIIRVFSKAAAQLTSKRIAVTALVRVV